MIDELEAFRHVHFVGIAGIGMSALARLLVARRIEISGSDIDPGEQGESLAELGITVVAGHAAGNIRGADLVVVSSAVTESNPEIEAAREQGIRIVKRAELLAVIMNAGFGIAVAGTHGKTTTSALIAHVLIEAGRDPTVLIGGMSAGLASNARVGGDVTVVEADEYDGSFLLLRPAIAVLTNIEPDHLDFYKTIDRLHDAFRTFVAGVRDVLVVCADDAVALDLGRQSPATLFTYGLLDGDWQAGNIRHEKDRTTFTARFGNERYACESGLAGEHNVSNVLATLAVATAMGVPVPASVAAIATFQGVARRFERKGEAAGVLVIDDYAHHPTEIRVNLRALRERFGRPVRVIFQPHTYSRTRDHLEDFALVLAGADATYVMDVYASREQDTLGISSRDLVAAMHRHTRRASYTGSAAMTIEAVARDAKSGDVVVTMGAGDVYRVGPALLGALER